MASDLTHLFQAIVTDPRWQALLALAVVQWALVMAAAYKSHTFDWNKVPDQGFNIVIKWGAPIVVAYFAGGWVGADAAAVVVAASLAAAIKQAIEALLAGTSVAAVRAKASGAIG